MQTAGGTGLDQFHVGVCAGVCAGLTFVGKAYPIMAIGYMHNLRGINL